MKIPYEDVFDMDGQRKVLLGILGAFLVEVVKDDAGRRSLTVADADGDVVNGYTRAQVLETFALSLIEREEDTKEPK